MGPAVSGNGVLVFETTHHAMWAEEVAADRGIPAEVVPAPPEVEAKCGLALRTLPGRIKELEGALDEEGVPYDRAGGGGSPG